MNHEPDGPNSPYPPQGTDGAPDPDPAPGRRLVFACTAAPCKHCRRAILTGPVVCPECVALGFCTICGEQHRAWQCPRIRVEWERQEKAALHPLDRTQSLERQLGHLARMARKAQTRGWVMVARELKEQAQNLCDEYVDTDALCADGHPLDGATGRCETCDDRHEQLMAARRAALASACMVDLACGF